MNNPDDALSNLVDIASQFETFVRNHGTVTEADTRANLIDKMLSQVCGWPDDEVSREESVDGGYIDYTLRVQGRPFVAVEAKKQGISFVFPAGTHKSLKLSGPILTEKHVAAAVKQVRSYCDDEGIRYAIATNGYAWIVFRAIREDMPWRDGYARIFPSLEYVRDNFTQFWNLLSYGAIVNGSLDSEFGRRAVIARRLGRVLDNLHGADLPLQRNRLHYQLDPLLQAVFENIADQTPPEILRSCYVHTGTLKVVVRELNTVITDAIPKFLQVQQAEGIFQTPDSAGNFGDALEEAVSTPEAFEPGPGQLYLLLGGIGSGKTTFIKRYQREVGRGVLEERSLWFHLDFLAAPIDPQQIELFVWRSILSDIRSRYSGLETRRTLKQIFEPEIAILSQTVLIPNRLRKEQYQDALSPYLVEYQNKTETYVPRLLRYVRSRQRLPVIIFIDNVDQLASVQQAQLFLLAQSIARTVGSITILALREESYYSAQLQRTLTAYTNRKFHIASPKFTNMIDYRIRFSIDMLEHSKQPLDYVLRSGITIDRRDISEFLKIVEVSIFQRNYNIARLIESLCFGNMRLALKMFSTFLTSGATDVDKMLSIYRASGSYYVAFHEFVKSIMLNDRRYYKDTESPILNVFECSTDRNSSHFTALRALRALLARRGESTVEGRGYVDIAELIAMSEDVFDNREDFVRTLNRLVSRQLVEVNTRSPESIEGATYLRVTASGWYYLRHLVKTFPYLDLVMQDTPLNDESTASLLFGFVKQVDNLSDRPESKVERVEIRFKRVRAFLEYLRKEEEHEQRDFDLARRGGLWSEPFIPDLVEQVEREIEWVGRRLMENRELFPEEIVVWEDSEEIGLSNVAEVDDQLETEELD